MKRLIKFEKPGCVPCATMQNYLEELNAEVEKVNPFEKPELAIKYNIASVPTLVLVNEEGNMVASSSGFKPDEIAWLVSLTNE